MSVLETPRIYFKGNVSWDPIVTNNYNSLYSETDLGTIYSPPLPEPPTSGVSLKPSIQDLASAFRTDAFAQVTPRYGNWNPHGTHRVNFFDATVNGADAGQGNWTEDSFVHSAVNLTGMLVDVEPFGSFSSQVFFDQMRFGVEGGQFIGAKRSARFTARYINFNRSSGNTMIAGVASVVWQTSFLARDLIVGSGNSAVLQALQEALETDPIVQGLTVRFNAYRTIYFDDQNLTNGPSTRPSYMDRQTKLLKGGFQPNPARSKLVGVVGLWRQNEPMHEPGDRVLVPVGLPLLGAVYARAEGSTLTLDLANSIPEVSSAAVPPSKDKNLTKQDLGTLQVVAIDGTGGEPVLVGSIPYGEYNETAYEATAGIVTLDLSNLPPSCNLASANLALLPGKVELAAPLTFGLDYTLSAPLPLPSGAVQPGTLTLMADTLMPPGTMLAAPWTLAEPLALTAPLSLSAGTSFPATAHMALPPGSLLAAGTVLPAGTTLPMDTILPAGTSLPEGTHGNTRPLGTTVPPGTTLPGGTLLLEPVTLQSPLKLQTGMTLVRATTLNAILTTPPPTTLTVGTTAMPGTTLPAGTVLQPNTTFNAPTTLPMGVTVVAIYAAGQDLTPGTTLPAGTQINAGNTVPPPMTALVELPLRAIPVAPNFYNDADAAGNSNTPVTFRVYRRGLPAGAGIPVVITAFDAATGGLMTPATVSAVTDANGYCGNYYQWPNGAGIVGYVPACDPDGTDAYNSDQGLNTQINTYMYARCLPNDAAIAAMLPTWDNVYTWVLANWNAMAPCMDNWLDLSNPTQILKYAPIIYRLTDPANFENYRFMPVTRDMSQGQRALLRSFLASGGTAGVTTTTGAVEYKSAPAGTVSVASRAMRRPT